MATRFDEYLETRLREDPEFAEEYEKLGPRFDAIGQLIKARKKAGITQTELARRMHVLPHVVSRLESAEHSPRLDTLAMAARAMGYQVTIRFRRVDKRKVSPKRRSGQKRDASTPPPQSDSQG